MMSSAVFRLTGWRRQRGAVTILGAVSTIVLIAAAVLSILVTTGSSLHDAMNAEKQVAALFLAESGIERAQATMAKAVTGAGGYADSSCTGLMTGTRIPMGRGGFAYESAVSVPPICGGSNSPCTECKFTVSGQVDAVTRRIQSQVKIQFDQGVTGHSDTFTLEMNALRPGGAAFTNLAYRATATLATDVASNASVGACMNTGGPCDFTSQGWDMQRTGANNVSNTGAFAPANAGGRQTITTSLVTNSKTPAARNYVHTGVFFYPSQTGDTVRFRGRYAEPTGSSPTASTSSTSGELSRNFHCGGTTYTTAAESDTLVYGFSSKPVSAGMQLDGVKFGGARMKRIVNLTGAEGDFLYSQIWFTWNPSYSTSGSASGSGTTITLTPATSAAPAVGTSLGIQSGTGAFDSADLTGSVNGNVLTVTAVASGSLRVGDVLFGRHLTPGVQVDGLLSGAGGVGTYRVCTRTPTQACDGQVAPSGPVTARVGVVSTASNGTFVVSRAPRIALSNATLCGGICALMHGASGASTRSFDLTNITSGDDWASGFACLSGVDPSSAQVLGFTRLKRTSWSERIQ